MDERGKGLEAFGNQININNNYADFSYSSAPCKQHPYSSTIGICAYCLKDRLVKLVCSECGEQRMSSCSCSDVSSSYRNSCSTSMEVGSVGRISFLIENDQKIENNINSNSVPTKEAKPEQVIFLRRSSSSCVEVKKTNGFWKIKRLFRKRKDKQGRCVKNDDDEDGEVWVSDVMGVTRSRSVCSFRGVGSNFNDAYEDYRFSSAKISDVTGGIFLDYDKQCGGSRFESESRTSGLRDVFDADHLIDLKRVKSHNKIDFTTTMDESSYIDLKLDPSDVMKQAAEFSSSGARISTCSYIDDHGLGFFKSDATTGKISANENGLLKKSSSRRHHNHSVWKWILKYHPSHNKKG